MYYVFRGGTDEVSEVLGWVDNCGVLFVDTEGCRESFLEGEWFPSRESAYRGRQEDLRAKVYGLNQKMMRLQERLTFLREMIAGLQDE